MSLVAFWLVLVGLFSPVSAADATGVLKVATTAPGAEVYLDGGLVGTAPLTKYIVVGKHKLRVVADNFDPLVRLVDIQAGKTVELNATLTPGPGSIEFTGPPGCTVTIAGQTYSVPIRIPSPWPGALEYRAGATGFEDAQLNVQLVKGRNYLIDLVLESSEGVIAITTKPVGASVQMDGEDIGVTPTKRTGQANGLHGVAVSLDGYGTAYRTVDTTKGGRGAADVTLSKSFADLTVNTSSDGARVLFNRVEVGSGLVVKVPHVAKGRLEVTIVDGEKTLASGKFEVPESGALTLRQAGSAVIEQKPLTQQWTFWAAVGGGALVAGTTAGVVVAATQPEPAPVGDVVVTLP